MTVAMKATAALLLVLTAGCASRPAAPVAPSFSDTPLPVAPRSAARGGISGGVFNPDAGLALTSDSRAFRVGDVVTLWGPPLPVETIARRAGTISYELTCGVTRRVLFAEDGA